MLWLGVVAVVWVLHWVLTPSLSNWMGGRFEAQVLALAKGRVSDAPAFLRSRAQDAAVLLTALVLLGQTAWQARRLIVPRFNSTWAWLPLSAVWVIAINVFLRVAGGTALWWMMLHAAHPNLQLTAFHIERILAEEAPSPIRVVVLGSSQGQSEIATGELTAFGKPDVRAVNLSYAGATADDLVLMREHYQTIDPQVLVLYLSPINVYGGASGTRWTPLLKARSLAYLKDTEIVSIGEFPRLLQGVIGLGLPMVQQRRAFQHALFGLISEQGYTRPEDAATVEEEAEKYLPVERSLRFETSVLESFIVEEATAGRQVALIRGTLHPDLIAALAPGVVAGFDALMERLETIHPNVTVLDNLPSHPPEDYRDLYHIHPDARSWFTRTVALRLSEQLNVPFRVPNP